jgi:hypothetical protein
MNVPRRRVLAAVAALVLFGVPPDARAGSFLPGFSGNTRMGGIPGQGATEGIVNFAVFENTDGNFLDEAPFSSVAALPLVIGSPLIDVTAGFVYLFQVVNDDPVNPEAALDAFRLPVSPGSNPQVTSAGFFLDTVFTDTVRDNGSTGSGIPVGGPSNKFLGAQPANPNNDDPLDNVPSLSGVTGVGLAAIPAVAGGNPFDPSSVDLATRQVRWAPGIMPVLGFSSVFFFTSNVGPAYRPGEIGTGDLNLSGSPRSNGDVPVPTPEPGTLVLWSVAVLGLGGASCWRRWRGDRSPVAA